MKGTFCSSHLTSRATSLSLCSGVTLLERALYILNRIRTFSSIVSTSPSVFLLYLSLFSFTFLFLDRYRFYSKKKKKNWEKVSLRCNWHDWSFNCRSAYQFRFCCRWLCSSSCWPKLSRPRRSWYRFSVNSSSSPWS